MYLAAGARHGDVNGLRVGYARLYARSGTDWNMIQQINGTVSHGDFGISLDLSHDGSMLAIGSRGSTSGHVYMYELSTSSFLYELLHTTGYVSAAEVSVSGDGKVVGVASWSSVNGAKIYERIGDGFQQRGTDINYGFWGSGIALSYDGSIFIVGDTYWDSDTIMNIGRAGVFQWRDDNEDGSMEWVQMGSDITGNAANDFLGFIGCVSITYDGLTVAVGAERYDRDGLKDRGLVRVYNHNSTSDTWNESGVDLVGDNTNDQFSKTALSSDGTYLFVGAYGTYGSANYARLFAKNGDNYEAVGDTIIGEHVFFGFSVDISADASALVVGDYSFDNYDYNGTVYLYDSFSSSSSLDPTSSSSLPPSLKETSTPSGSPSFSPSLVSSAVPSAAPVTPKPTASPTMAPTTADPTRVPPSSSLVSMNPIASSSLHPPSSPMSYAKSSLICILLLWMF